MKRSLIYLLLLICAGCSRPVERHSLRVGNVSIERDGRAARERKNAEAAEAEMEQEAPSEP